MFHDAGLSRDTSRTSTINEGRIPKLRETSRICIVAPMNPTGKVNIAALKKALIEATGPGKPWSRRKLSLAAGMGPDGVRDIISGRSKNPELQNLIGLADALGVPLSTFIDAPEVSAPLTVEVVGAVAAGVWREQSEWDPEERYTITAGPSPLPSRGRFALVVEGFSMDKKFPPGTVLDCLNVYNGIVVPMPGDFVIVRRQNGGLYETTCKELVQNEDGTFSLVAHSTRPEFQEPIHIGRPDGDHFGDTCIEVIGIVIGAYQSVFRRR